MMIHSRELYGLSAKLQLLGGVADHDHNQGMHSASIGIIYTGRGVEKKDFHVGIYIHVYREKNY